MSFSKKFLQKILNKSIFSHEFYSGLENVEFGFYKDEYDSYFAMYKNKKPAVLFSFHPNNSYLRIDNVKPIKIDENKKEKILETVSDFLVYLTPNPENLIHAAQEVKNTARKNKIREIIKPSQGRIFIPTSYLLFPDEYEELWFYPHSEIEEYIKIEKDWEDYERKNRIIKDVFEKYRIYVGDVELYNKKLGFIIRI